jgi:phospholipase/lecithinase/hemolysin
MKNRFATLAVTATLAAGLTAAPAAASPLDRFSDIYVFGDSLSDPGNLFNALFGAPASPAFPVYPDAQFTDGAAWASQIGADFASGRNFAHGSARAAPTPAQTFTFPDLTTPSDPFDTVDIVFDVPDFADQIALYQASGQTLGANPLAAVWFGGNDLRDAVSVLDPFPVVASALNSIGAGLASLAGEGFTNLAVFGLPDLGKIPEIRALGDGAMAAATAATVAFNDNLQDLLAVLPSTLPIPVEVTYVDTFDLFNDILGDPTAFGFQDAETACLDALLVGAVPNCAGFVFYDDIHPTAQAHALIAERFTAAVAPVPLPAGWVLMLSLGGALALLRRRQRALA